MVPPNKAPNSTIVVGDGECIQLCLTNRAGETVGWTTLDIEDYKGKITEYRWSLRPDGYAYNFQLGRLHHNIIGKPIKPLEVDHINRNRLDNRRYNLRVVDKTTQQINRGLQSNNKSGLKCIFFSEERQKYVVQVQRCGKCLARARFETLPEAIAFRDKHYGVK